MPTLHHAQAGDLKQAVRDARSDAERDAQKHYRTGVLRSRGAWVIVTTKGEGLVTDGTLEFTGTQKQLDELLRYYAGRPDVEGIYIEGGFNWAESVRAFADCDYEPWVTEWTVTVWTRE